MKKFKCDDSYKRDKKRDSYKRAEITALIFILLYCDYLFLRQFFSTTFCVLATSHHPTIPWEIAFSKDDCKNLPHLTYFSAIPHRRGM